MHTYYVHGVATWEVARMLAQWAEHGLSLDTLRNIVCSIAWKRNAQENQGGRGSKSYLRGLLSEKKISADDFRGAAHEIKSLLPLL